MVKVISNFFAWLFYKECDTCPQGLVPRYAEGNVLVFQSTDGIELAHICDDCWEIFSDVEEAYNNGQPI